MATEDQLSFVSRRRDEKEAQTEDVRVMEPAEFVETEVQTEPVDFQTSG